MSAEVRRRNRAIQVELLTLQQLGLLTAEQRQQIAHRYPTTAADLLGLVRWFTILGSVGAGLGMLLLLGSSINLYSLIEGGSTLLFCGLLLLARWLKRPRVPAEPAPGGAAPAATTAAPQARLLRVAASLELLACFALTALTLTLGKQHDTGSGHWPALFGLDLLVLVPMAYVLVNRLVLIYACINLFVFFGGETGYVSGWGMYWLGMNYPLRFLVAGLVCIGIGWLHGSGQVPALRPYAVLSRVYQHFGMLVVNFALWFFALFGYFSGHDELFRRAAGAERLLFSVLWALFCGGSLYVGVKRDLSILRAHGQVFLLINMYTFYFQFVALHSGELWFLHMLLIGGSLTYLGISLERRHRRTAPALSDAAPASSPAAPSAEP